jgi:uncharacterized protein YjbI with pentapeptide repeats
MGNKNSRTSGTKEDKHEVIVPNPRYGETPSDKLLRLLSIGEKNEPCNELMPTALECIMQKANADVNNAIYTKFANADKNKQAESQLVYLMDGYLPGGKPYTLDNLYNLNLKFANLSYDNTTGKIPNVSEYGARGLNFSRAPPGYKHKKDAKIDPTFVINNLTGVNMDYANLIWSNFNCLHLKSAKLNGANMEHSQLQDANMEMVDMNYANLRGAHLEGAHLTYANLRGANLRGAHLDDAHLIKAHLEGADLRGAHLEDADLRGAHLEDADLRAASLRGADLTDAHLTHAKTMDKEFHRLHPETILTSFMVVKYLQ